MENTLNRDAGPMKCQVCSHSTNIRESSGQGGRQVRRLSRPNPEALVGMDFGIQYQSWMADRGFPGSLLSSSGGLSTTIRGHGLAVTVQGDSKTLLNFCRVAYAVFNNPVIQSQVCYGCGPLTGDAIYGGSGIIQGRLPELEQDETNKAKRLRTEMS
nr:hypothetical protein [Tolivirales sp.]